MWHADLVDIFQRNGLQNFDLPKIGTHTQMIAARYKSYIQHQRKKMAKKIKETISTGITELQDSLNYGRHPVIVFLQSNSFLMGGCQNWYKI
jgi:hypothetical protein